MKLMVELCLWLKNCLKLRHDKTAEGRSKIYSAINNVDRAKLSMLRQSAEGLRERQK